MKNILITNNPKVFEKNKDKMEIIYSNEYSYLDILYMTRDKIHNGYRLLTHPLSGSVKPNETPYKSTIVMKEEQNLDLHSLDVIEKSIQTASKFLKTKKTPKWTNKILEDFQVIDFSLIDSAIESIYQFKKC